MSLTGSEEVSGLRIVVGVDESDGGRDALRWAAREAAAHEEAVVVAVLAWGLLDQHPVDDVGFLPGYTESDAAAALGRLVADTLPADTAEGVEQLVVCDVPARALLDAASGADLLVMGARGLGGFRGLLLGSVSQRCLHHAVIPTVVVHRLPPAEAAPRFVVGVDGSPASQTALAWALEEARAHGARLTVVHTYPLPVAGALPHAVVGFDAGALSDAAERALDAALAAADPGDVELDRVVEPGPPAAVLLAAAAGADLVVVGTRGLGAVKRLVLGSVASQVAHHAPCPVAVVPAPH